MKTRVLAAAALCMLGGLAQAQNYPANFNVGQTRQLADIEIFENHITDAAK